MKKRISAAIALCLALVMVLAACGNDAAPSNASTPTPASASSSGSSSGDAAAADSVDTGALDFVTVQWYLPPPSADMSNQASVMAVANEIFREKINAELEFIFLDWGVYEDKMRTMSAGGEPWDVCMTASWLYNVNQNASTGAFHPLNDLLNQYGQNILKSVESSYWPAVTFGGEKYAIINNMAYATLRGAGVSREMADKYGLTLTATKEHTLRELEPFLQQIKDNEPTMTPLCVVDIAYPMCTDNTFDFLTNPICYDLTDGKVKTAFETAQRRDDYHVLADFYAKGFIAKDAALISDYTIESQSGKYGVFFDGGSVTEDGSKISVSYGFDCVNILAGVQGVIGTGTIQSALSAIGRNSKNPERTMMLIDMMFEDAFLFNTLCYGLEGQDYSVITGDTRSFSDDLFVEMSAETKWVIWHPWIGDLFLQWPSALNTAEALAKFRYDNEFGKVSPIIGFVVDMDPIMTELAQISAIGDEASAILNTGTLGSAEAVDAYIAETLARMEAVGLSTAVAEIERQIAAWR